MTLDLESNQRTVLQLAAFFAELKSNAGQLVSRAGASERGYFSPREEDATNELLVSYWHARNALFDLITNLRQVTQLSAEEQDRAFVVGFAAALLLVDAARFLREVVEVRPLVKRKLNEPAPGFGIPAGVYDTVQKSLVSTRQGWHLYHAIKYFEQHEGRLRARPADSGEEGLLQVILQLRHRLKVPVGQFSRAKLKTRGAQLGSRLTYTLFGRAMYGLQKLAGTLVADKYLRLGHQPALPPEIADQIQGLLQPGDVLAVRKEYALTTYFLPGYWPHVALYLGSAVPDCEAARRESLEPFLQRLGKTALRPGIVLESMRDGVHFRSLSSPFGSDSIVVMRPQLAAADVREALTRSLNHHGKPYDFAFDFTRSDRLVCTEVVYRAFDGIGSMHLPLVQRIGRPTLSGDDLIGMAVASRAFDAVAVFAPTFSREIATGESAQRLIHQARQTEPTV